MYNTYIGGFMKEVEEVKGLDEDLLTKLNNIPDDVLQKIMFSSPWQYGNTDGKDTDADGFPNPTKKNADSTYLRNDLQQECWEKFHQNPFVNTTVRGQVGRQAGWGFETTSDVWEIQEAIEQIELDYRNRLYNFYPKYFGRLHIEGELFLLLSLHLDGFVEIDFIDPGSLRDNGDDNTGILFHPFKSTMPLFYNIKTDTGQIQIPSIYIARDSELYKSVVSHKDYNRTDQQFARSKKARYKKIGGYSKFIVACDKGFVTRRAVSYLRTILEWLNHYDNLKKYEIDHKKSPVLMFGNFGLKNLKILGFGYL